MVLRILALATVVVVGVSADACGDLDRLLDLGAGSYAKATHAVTVEEAAREHARLVAEWDKPLQSKPTSPVVEVTDHVPAIWSKPEGPVEMEPFIKTESGPMELLVMGDVGYANSLLRASVKTARRKLGSIVDAAILLGDNFYPYGIITDITDPQFKNVFDDIIAAELPFIPFHAILGNHDWLGKVDAQLEYTSIHPQWNMPYYYYMRRLISEDTVTCTWFLDTETIYDRKQRAQLDWLERTLAQSNDCDWKILVGHHPMFDAGEYRDDSDMIEKVLPIAEKYGVDLYMSGHEHQTQVLHDRDVSPLHFIISGCTAEKRSGKARVHPMLVWSDPQSTAFVQLSISKTELVYRIHKGAGYPVARPLYEGVIRRHPVTTTTEHFEEEVDFVHEENDGLEEQVVATSTEDILEEVNVDNVTTSTEDIVEEVEVDVFAASTTSEQVPVDEIETSTEDILQEGRADEMATSTERIPEEVPVDEILAAATSGEINQEVQVDEITSTTENVVEIIQDEGIMSSTPEQSIIS